MTTSEGRCLVGATLKVARTISDSDASLCTTRFIGSVSLSTHTAESFASILIGFPVILRTSSATEPVISLRTFCIASCTSVSATSSRLTKSCLLSPVN